MHGRRILASIWLVYLVVIFPLALGGMLFGRADSGAQLSHAVTRTGGSYVAQVVSLSPVDEAIPGAKVRLWAQVKNISGASLPLDARAWFWVDNGPGWSANHWVGSASIAGLVPGTDNWYSFDWTVPANAPDGNYTYWVQVWTSIAISEWSGEQQFTVAKIPNLVGEWKGELAGYFVANCLVPDPTNLLGKPRYGEDSSEEQTLNILEQTGRAFASWDAEGRKWIGVLLPDGTVKAQAFEPTEFRAFFTGTLRTVGGRLVMTGSMQFFDDFGLSKPDPASAGHFNMGTVSMRYVKVK